jgi:hypothetical protein
MVQIKSNVVIKEACSLSASPGGGLIKNLHFLDILTLQRRGGRRDRGNLSQEAGKNSKIRRKSAFFKLFSPLFQAYFLLCRTRPQRMLESVLK